MAEEKRPRPWLLPALLMSGAVLGLVLGGLLGHRWADPSLQPLVVPVRLAGTVFLSLLKALIVPLIVTSMVVGVAKLGDLRKVGRLAGWTGAYFLITTLLAVATGLVLANLLQPGAHGPVHAAAAAPAVVHKTPLEAIAELVSGMFPPNLVEAAGTGNLLGLIVFSLLFAGALALDRKRGHLLVEVLDVANEALLRLVLFVVWLAPLGILGLIADRVGKAGGGAAVFVELRRLGWYALTVLLGLFIHAAVTLPLALRLLAQRRPGRFIAGIADALITAFGTASSAATMSVTLKCTEAQGVSRRAADFVIPLGTTLNMNGTALYEAVAVLFIAQSLGMHLSLVSQIIVLITASLAAIGAAAIPEAGLITMVLVTSAVGLPPEGIAMILSIDWLLDRFRTAVNVMGDAVGAAVVDRWMPADEPAKQAEG
jgi:Na+/H+-dicarboxylate symporter